MCYQFACRILERPCRNRGDYPRKQTHLNPGQWYLDDNVSGETKCVESNIDGKS